MTNFPGLKSEAQLKELLLQEAEDEELWIDWRQGKDLRDEETHLSSPASPQPYPPTVLSTSRTSKSLKPKKKGTATKRDPPTPGEVCRKRR